MKTLYCTSIVVFAALSSYGQILLEDKTGDVIVRNQFRSGNDISLIKLNTGDQSLGFNYITSTKPVNKGKYKISEFGIKARPTEGFVSVFNNNQFSPGVKISYVLTKVRIFSEDRLRNNTLEKASFIDWGGLEINYDVNKYTLYKSDTSFSNQFYSKTFKPLGVFLHYNYLRQKGELNGKLLISLKAGYSRRNNYDNLRSLEIQDVKTILDPTNAASRQIIQKRTAKEGVYEEFDAYPLTLSFTFLTQTDAAKIPNPVYEEAGLDSIIKLRETVTLADGTQREITRDSVGKTMGTPNTEKEIANPDVKKLRMGFNTYLKNTATNIGKPVTRIGAIFFLTTQNEKTGIRTPVFGLNIQAEDPFDVQNSNNGLQSRISIGFTSIFSL